VGNDFQCVESARHRHGVDARLAIAQHLAVEENLPWRDNTRQALRRICAGHKAIAPTGLAHQISGP